MIKGFVTIYNAYGVDTFYDDDEVIINLRSVREIFKSKCSAYDEEKPAICFKMDNEDRRYWVFDDEAARDAKFKNLKDEMSV